MMKSHGFRHLLAAVVPLLSMAGALVGFRIFCVLIEATETSASTVSAGTWSQIFVALISAFICSLIALWWASSYFLYIYRFILFELRVSSQAPSIPSWAPAVLKVLISGSLSVSLIAGPQQANALAADSAGADAYVSQTVEIMPEALGTAERPYTQLTTADDRLQDPPDPYQVVASPSVSPLFSSTSSEPPVRITPVSNNSHQPISPLFGGLSTPNGQASQHSSREQNSTGNTKYSHYTVKSGESLWSIAEDHMPKNASGTEVLNLVYEIQRLNNDTIPTLDSLIFPGQQILLPL